MTGWPSPRVTEVSAGGVPAQAGRARIAPETSSSRSKRAWQATSAALAGRQAGSFAVRIITKSATATGTRAGSGGSGRSRCAIATSSGGPEKGRPRQALVGHDAQRVQVARRPALASGDPLRRDVAGRPHHRPGRRQGSRADRVGDAEIRDPHGTVRREHDVRRLDVTVDEPRAVRCLQARRDLGDDVHGPRGVERPAGQHRVQRRPLDQFHDQVGLASFWLTVVEDPRDVLVFQGTGVQRLGLEPGLSFGLMSVSGM